MERQSKILFQLVVDFYLLANRTGHLQEFLAQDGQNLVTVAIQRYSKMVMQVASGMKVILLWRGSITILNITML